MSSETGIGTTFRIFFPLLDEKQSVGDEGQLEGVGLYHGRETILLAEDEELVRKLTCDILERAGYNVLTASDGEEAVELFRRNRGQVDLLLLDVIMPGIHGTSAAMQIRKMSPAIPLVFLTGYTDDLLRSDKLFQLGGRLLNKPCEAQVLLRTLREELDKVKDHSLPI